MDVLNVFNILSLVVFVALGFLAARKMEQRRRSFRKYKIPVPILLKRDIALFGSLGMYFGSILIVLVLGIINLGREPLWVIPRGLIVLGAMAYWVWVEYHLEDAEPKKEE